MCVHVTLSYADMPAYGVFSVYKKETILKIRNIIFTEIHKYDMHKSVELQLNSTKSSCLTIKMNLSAGSSTHAYLYRPTSKYIKLMCNTVNKTRLAYLFTYTRKQRHTLIILYTYKKDYFFCFQERWRQNI